MIISVFFGLSARYGVPSGLLGVFLSSFLGWFLGKSMIETKGFFWAWLIHFLPDARAIHLHILRNLSGCMIGKPHAILARVYRSIVKAFL